MKQVRTPSDIKSLGTIMSIWAHPDDESFCAAGIMTTAIDNGQKVVCITATKGEEGVKDESRWPSDELADIRARELRDCLDVLGIDEHHFLGYRDGCCEQCPTREAVAKIRKHIDRHKPDTILTFGPDGITGHNDHKKVSEWVSRACENMDVNIYHAVEEERAYKDYLQEADKKFNIYFNTDKPPIYSADKCDIAFRLDDKLMQKKLDSLRAMPSQTEELFIEAGEEFLKNAFDIECFVAARTK